MEGITNAINISDAYQFKKGCKGTTQIDMFIGTLIDSKYPISVFGSVLMEGIVCDYPLRVIIVLMMNAEKH